MNSPVGPKVRPGTILRVAQPGLADLPPLGTLGTAVFVGDLRVGVQWGPDDRGFVTYEQIFRGDVTVFQP